jgi:hypothetical protein
VANPNPWPARLAKRRAHKPGTMSDVLKVLWTAIKDAEYLLYSAEDPEFRLRCVHALSQAAGQYAKLIEVGEFEARLTVVEDAQARRNGQ